MRPTLCGVLGVTLSQVLAHLHPLGVRPLRSLLGHCFQRGGGGWPSCPPQKEGGEHFMVVLLWEVRKKNNTENSKQ